METQTFDPMQWPDVPTSTDAPAPAARTLGSIPDGSFDRSTKVTFICLAHPEQGAWRSKDPFWSSWFPADDQASQWIYGSEKFCRCELESWAIVGDYPTPEV